MTLPINLTESIEWCMDYFDAEELGIIEDLDLLQLATMNAVGDLGADLRKDLGLWLISSKTLTESITGNPNSHPSAVTEKIFLELRDKLRKNSMNVALDESNKVEKPEDRTAIDESDWKTPLLAVAGAALISAFFSKKIEPKKQNKVKEEAVEIKEYS